MRQAHRLDGIPPTIFSTMSALAVQTGAVNLGQGFPDTDGPLSVREKARESLLAGENQYSPGIGRPALREAIAAHQERHYGLTPDPASEIVVTTGATEALAGAILGLINPGDDVLAIEPFYDAYPALIQMAGGRRIAVGLDDLYVDRLREAITPATRALLLNTPHNPSGRVLTEKQLAAVAQVAIEHDLVVISDEVYEHLTFDGVAHRPIATFPGMWERTVTISSVGKSYSLTGWKVGWASGPATLVGAVLGAKQWLSFTSAAPLQNAVAHALTAEADWPRELAADLQARRDLLCDGLRALGLTPEIPQGTYFATTDISHLGWADGHEFALALPGRAGVAVIPLQGFYDSDAGTHLVRWTFCKERPVIEEALGRLAGVSLTA